MGEGASRNKLARNAATGSVGYDLWESHSARRNKIAKSNRFAWQHRARK